MSPDVIDQVRSISSREFNSGDIIFHEKDVSDDTMYFVLSGEIGIYKNRPDGEREIAMVGPGNFFGEMALIGQRPRLATARVVTSGAKIAVINRETFLRLCGKSPQFLFNLLKYAVARLLSAEDKLQQVREELRQKENR